MYSIDSFMCSIDSLTLTVKVIDTISGYRKHSSLHQTKVQADIARAALTNANKVVAQQRTLPIAQCSSSDAAYLPSKGQSALLRRSAV